MYNIGDTLEIKPSNKMNEHVMSVSSLNLFATSPKKYQQHILAPQRVDTTYFTKGSAVDCLITESEKFQQEFAVMKISRPSGMMGDMCKLLADYEEVNTDNIPFDEIFDAAYAAVGFKLALETVRKKFNDPKNDYTKYYNFLVSSKGKKVISAKELAQAEEVVHMLKTDSETKKYIVDPVAHPLMEVHDQMELFFEFEGIDCKGYLDRVIVDHSTKTIKPTDIKTTGKSVFEFPKSCVQFMYYRQAAFYMQGLKTWILTQDNLKDYTIENFKFIVAEMDCINRPLVFEISEDDVYKSLFVGGTLKYSLYPIKSITELIAEVKWHRANDAWEMTKSEYENYTQRGCIQLEIFSKTRKD
jgi:hypothetical protein